MVHLDRTDATAHISRGPSGAVDRSPVAANIIRGPNGLAILQPVAVSGADGQDGVDGSNVLPTDAAIANALNDGDSETRAALAAQKRVVLYDTYTGKGTVSGNTADSGHVWVDQPSSGSQSPTVVSGILTHTTHGTAGPIASYRQYDLDAPVTAMGADMVFYAGSTTDFGATGLIPFASPRLTGPVPDTYAHIIFGPTITEIGFWVGGTFSAEATWIYDSSLITDDGVTGHRVGWFHDKANSTVHILLPTGDWKSFTDAALAADLGPVACFETYANEGTTDPRVGYKNVWASTAPQADPAADRATQHQLAELRYDLAGGPQLRALQVKTWAPGTRATVNCGAMAEVNSALRQTFTVPDSGNVKVSVQYHVRADASTWLLLAAYYDAGLTVPAFVHTALGDDGGGQAYRGSIGMSSYLSGLTPGDTHTLYFAAWEGAGTVSILADGPYGLMNVTTVEPAE